MPDNIDYLSKNQANALLGGIDDARDKAIVTLFLGTGIFLNELTALTIRSIDWKKKLLRVPGTRKRDIPLNDQVFDALANWSKERPDVRVNAFFLTTKGKIQALSARSVDKLIRKYADQARITKKVNAQILRNTFAVQLFSEKISIGDASKILGISDPNSLRRYIGASKGQPDADLSAEARRAKAEALAKADTRPALTQKLAGLFPTKPKTAKPITPLKGPLVPTLENVIFGRDSVLEDIKSHLSKKISTLITGRIGLGKTHILKYMAGELAPKGAIFMASSAPLKPLLIAVCDKLIPDWKDKIPGKTRASAKELSDLIEASFKKKETPILIIDMLDKLKASDIEPFLKLMESFTILAAADDDPPRLKQIWWKFKQIELNPVSNESAKDLIKYLTKNLAVPDFDFLEKRILTQSNRYPLAIVDMIHQLGAKQVIKSEDIRDLHHEAGMRYRDWTAAIVVLWGMAIMFRFIALGTHSFEGYILAGFGTAFMLVMRFFVFRMR